MHTNSEDETEEGEADRKGPDSSEDWEGRGAEGGGGEEGGWVEGCRVEGTRFDERSGICQAHQGHVQLLIGFLISLSPCVVSQRRAQSIALQPAVGQL